MYSLDDVRGDTKLSHFDIDNAPSFLFDVVSDILSINNRVKIHIVPWSPVCRPLFIINDLDRCSFEAWLDEKYGHNERRQPLVSILRRL